MRVFCSQEKKHTESVLSSIFCQADIKFKLLKKLNIVQFDCSATRLFVSYNFSFSVVELNYMEINYMYTIVYYRLELFPIELLHSLVSHCVHLHDVQRYQLLAWISSLDTTLNKMQKDILSVVFIRYLKLPY